MKFDLLVEISHWPLAYGLVAGAARWAWEGRAGGKRGLAEHIGYSSVVAWGMEMWLEGECLQVGRNGAYVLFWAFVAKDLLAGVAGIGLKVIRDPVERLQRKWDWGEKGK